jgi:hypothetical protein
VRGPYGKLIEEKFEGVIPLRRGGSKHYAQATASPEEHDLLNYEVAEELKRGLSRPRRATSSPDTWFTIPTSQKTIRSAKIKANTSPKQYALWLW